jgi:hypothetical protein
MGRKEVLLRLEEDQHARAAKAAAEAGVPLSRWIRDAIDARLAGEGHASSADLSAALAAVSDAAAKLAAGFVLVPGSEAGDSAWGGLLNGGGQP